MKETVDKDEKDIYCICQKPYVDGQFMIECGKCNEWFHGRYVNSLPDVYRSD